MKIDEYRNKLHKVQGKKEVLAQQEVQYTGLLNKASSRMTVIDCTQALIQKVAQETQECLRFQIEDVVNSALDTCFPDEYQFKANFVIKRGKTECELVFMRGDYEINPMDATGGGVVDIASMGLRIAAWSLSNTRNLLIFDEGLKWLSRDLQPRAGEILQEISKTLGLQIIMVSHSPDLILSSDKVYQIQKKEDISSISVV